MPLRTKIDTSVNLVNWIKGQLGYPTIQLEIEDNVILDNISSAIQLYQRYSGDIKYRNALIFDIVAGVDTYAVNENVESIIDFDTTHSFGGSVTTLFTVENILYNEGLLAGHAPMELVSWELAQQYMELLRDKFVAKFFVDHNKYKQEIKLTPKPTKAFTAILEVYSFWTHDIKTAIYDEIFIKNYSLALTKIVLGTIWNKYGGISLPGGGMLNGAELKNEGIIERDYWLENLSSWESEPMGYLIG